LEVSLSEVHHRLHGPLALVFLAAHQPHQLACLEALLHLLEPVFLAEVRQLLHRVVSLEARLHLAPAFLEEMHQPRVVCLERRPQVRLEVSRSNNSLLMLHFLLTWMLPLVKNPNESRQN
jgi:hypothetical protein